MELRGQIRRNQSTKSQSVLKKICDIELRVESKQKFQLRDVTASTYSQITLAHFPRQDILGKYLTA